MGLKSTLSKMLLIYQTNTYLKRATSHVPKLHGASIAHCGMRWPANLAVLLGAEIFPSQSQVKSFIHSVHLQWQHEVILTLHILRGF